MRLFHYAHFLSGFDYEVEYRAAAKHGNADYLSRFPVETVHETYEDQHCIYQRAQINVLDINPMTIVRETRNDEELNTLREALQNGRSLRAIGFNDNEFTLQDDCILKGTRVVIPQNLREQVLDELHAGHSGIVKMKALARSHVYWRNIDRDIEQKVNSCRACRLQQNEPPKAPLHHWEQPTRPWQRLHIDFAEPIQGQQLLIIVDAFTKWVEILPTKNTTSSWCIKKLRELFSIFVIPYTLVSDNGRQFVSAEFTDFMDKCGIVHKTSAPYHPATNGQAERYVQTIKKAIRAMKGEEGDLLSKLVTVKTRLRRTPNSEGQSPYQLMFGRDIRTSLHAMFRKTSQTTSRASIDMPTVKMFTPGDRVQVRAYGSQRWAFGTILRRLGQLHYEVQTDSGTVWRRHVEQLLPAPGIRE
ncbi:uncharacterized protein K02A2.6-like [Aricia agestis]|uniref:uncharacterized protein K02A2.6-like n=1 Tax=Aricia agestis TaxID=91739 RepID=UPI001C203E67|nr:uncharacterized protein K02A2.6-like [Aricia agestis]